MKILLTALCCVWSSVSLCQINDNFSDSDFSNNPLWFGNDTDFDAAGFDLHLNASAAGTSYLATAQTELGETTWEFLVHFDFNPSSTSLAKIYLVSDQSDLTGALNGYFVMVGDTEDEISLYMQNGNIESYVINGTDDTIDSGTVNVRIRVTRSATGEWSMYHDTTGGTNFIQEGTSTLETSFNTTAYFGIFCQYTVSRINAIYFDDFTVSTAAPGFAVSSVTAEGDRSIRITFNQDVDHITAEIVNNYQLNYGFGNPVAATRDGSNFNEVLLSFSENFVNNDYILNIDQVQNFIMDESIESINKELVIETQTPFRYIVVNEIMADPSPVAGLPDAEYLELYNAGDQAVNIADFMIDARTISEFVLEPNAYVVLTTSANTHLFAPDVIALSGLSLSNSGETLLLTDNLGNLVDSVSYTDNWYKNTDKDDGGYALEQINPELECSYENNWKVSSHVDGGTPGIQNDIYNNAPDTDGPNLIDFTAADGNTFLFTFDEPMDALSLNSTDYSFNNGILQNNVTPIGPGYFSTSVNFTPDLMSGEEYIVTVTGATDCAGNPIQTNSLTYIYDTEPPEINKIVIKTSKQIDVIFNEVLNETSAETEANYNSDHSGSNPVSANLDISDNSIVTLTFDNEFETDVENTLTVENIVDLKGNVMTEILTLKFTLSQQIDTVLVLGANLLEVYFKVIPNQSSAEIVENYAVNDGIGNPSTAFLDSDYNRLVHLVFDKNFDQNDDLTLAVTDILDKDLNELTTPQVTFIYDTSPPKLDSVVVTSSKTLSVVFTEKVEQQSAQSLENYEYNGIYPVDATLQLDERTVHIEFAENFEREVFFELTIDEVKDLYFNEIKTRLKQAFVYDIFEPELDSVIVRSPNQLILWFNENVDVSTAESTSNYHIGKGIGEPISASINLEYPHLVYLELPESLPESSEIDLVIAEMKDEQGNSISKSISASFDYDLFYISTITPVSSRILQMEFNKKPDSNAANTGSNYSVNGKNPTAVKFLSNRRVELKFKTEFADKSLNQLELKNLSDLYSNEMAISEYTFGFDSRIVTASVIGDRSVLLAFEIELDQTQQFDLLNFSASPSLGNCLAASIDEDDPHLLRLTFENPLETDQIYHILWSEVFNVYGHRLPDFKMDVNIDQTPPSILNHVILDSQSIWLKYSEPLNENSAELLNNYWLDQNIGYPAKATYLTSDSSVVLTFAIAFQEQINYLLFANNIEDLSDNALVDYELKFVFEDPLLPGFGDLIITEIMADPSPEIGLPDAEYLEVYNTTAETISLAGITVVDETGSTLLKSGEVPSKGYTVLSSTSAVGKFTDTAAVGVSNFPSLNNSGETISLYADGSLIFSTTYSSDWYKNEDKKGGGWSLEMIDLNNPCGENGNWTASISESGGTPGLANSVSANNPDNFGPMLINVVATEEKTVLLEFNEKLHPGQISNATFQFSPILALDSVQLIFPSTQQIQINLAENLEPRQWYELSVSDVYDCRSNQIRSGAHSVKFRLPETAIFSDLIINEVLFNPRTGGVDFVELYNKSDKTINLNGWILTDAVEDGRIITEEHLLINPDEYLVLTPDPNILLDHYPVGNASSFIEMINFPSLSNDQDSVILIDDQGLVIDAMRYTDDFHFKLLNDDEGVSLERISFESEPFNSNSWKSAASTAGFATPGYLNSQYIIMNKSPSRMTIEPKVFIPDNSGVNDFTTISYQLEKSGNFANVHIFSSNGILVNTLAEGELLPTNGFLIWDGLTNDGNRATVGYYIVFFEIFDGQGNKFTEKETVVLGARF